jgi:hypothetical protein
MIVGLSSIAMAVIALLNRNILNYLRTGNFFFTEQSKQRVVIVGIDSETARISRLIRSELDYPVEIEGTVRITEDRESLREDSLGTLSQLGEIVRIYKVDEVIFANKDFSTEEILTAMSALQLPALRYKIVPPDADYLVGPQVIHDSLSAEGSLFNLALPEWRSKKRSFDIAASSALLLLYPLSFFIYKRPLRALGNLWKTLKGEYHMVGYIDPQAKGLPKLKPGLLNMAHRVSGSEGNPEHNRGLDRHYARAYSVEMDLEVLVKGLRGV